MTMISVYGRLFLQFGLLPLLLFGAVEYYLVRKGRSGRPLLIVSGVGAAVCLFIAVQPTIDMAAAVYKTLFGNSNSENAGFFMLFCTITLIGALLGTLLAYLLGRKEKRA